MPQQSIAAVTYLQLLVPEVFAAIAHSDLRHCDIISFRFLITDAWISSISFHISSKLLRSLPFPHFSYPW